MQLDLNLVVEFLKMLFKAAEAAFKTAFSSPISGIIIGGFLYLLGRLAKALEAAGLLIVVVALAMLILNALGIKLP
jgi:hypothetical protein